MLQKELLLQPDWNGHLEGLKTPRRKREIRFEQALKLEKRLVVERDKIDLIESHPSFGQAVRKSVTLDTRIVFSAAETLFLRRRHNFTVNDQCCGTVVIECRNTEDPHGVVQCLEKRVDERRHG